MKNKRIAIITAGIFAAVFAWMVLEKNSTTIDTSHIPHNLAQQFPTIGSPNAPIKIIAFEEPLCSSCYHFSNEVFPKLRTEFIDQGKASFTLIPVSFIKGSQPLAQALLCVYNHNKRKTDPEAYVEYFHRILEQGYHNNFEWDIDEVISLSQDLSTNNHRRIQPKGLKQCIDSGIYIDQLKKNHSYAMSLLDGELATPTIIVGDQKIQDPNFEDIAQAIEQLETLENINEALYDTTH